MAESEFIRYQDKNRDGLIDVCEVDVETVEVPCLDCSPNPNALVDDWKKKTIDEPFLNEKTCEYQITVITKHKTTLSATLLEKDSLGTLTTDEEESAMEGRFDEYVDDAIESLLSVYNKDDSDESKEAIKEVMSMIQEF